LDVTPLSLGVETLGGVMTTLIKRNTTIPTRKSEIFSTAEDSQTAVDIHILQGERPIASDNMTLGRFRLEGIPPAPRGIPQVEVTFDIDANGILNVTAQDKATSKEQKITITASTNLSQTEVERMVRESQDHAGEDSKRKERVEARNQADHLVYQAEKTLNELGAKVDGSVRADIEGKINDVKSAMESDDLNRIKTTTNALQQALMQIGQAAYQQTQSPPGASENGQDEGVVEGEYTEA